ncbi:MAG: complex I subunit 5 family protein, partial [Dehalococcoidia bacterium]
AVALAFMDGRRPAVRWFAVCGMAGVLVCTALLAWEVFAQGTSETMAGGWPRGVGIVLRADPLTVAFVLVTTAMLLAAMAHEAALGVNSRSFPALLAFLAAGLNGLFLTGDVFNFYVFFEVSMASAVVLAAYPGGGRQLRAAYTFAVVNLLGSVFYLGGTAALYHLTGTLDMREAERHLSTLAPGPVLAIGAAFFVSFGVKLGLFPFHFWVPPVYRDADPAVAAALSGAVANIGSYGLLRFGGDLLTSGLRVAEELFLVLAIASILYGGVLAVARRHIAEVLAYSAIGQAGYILLAVALGGPLGFAAAVFYTVVNSINKTLLFLVQRQRGPLVAGAFAIGAASVAGLPPSAGFFGKAGLFRAAIDKGDFFVIAAIAAGSVLSLIYMAQVYERQFWRAPRVARSALPARLLALALAVALLGLGLWPEPLLALAARAGAALGETR